VINNLETTLRHRFRLMRLINDHLMTSDCEIECDLAITLASDPNEIQLRLSAMKLWLEDFVDNSIAYDPMTELETDWLDLLHNNVIMTPGDPRDHIILAVLHSKLSTIGGSVVSINKTHFITDTSHGFSNSMTGSAEEWLPSMGEWIGQRHFHKTPWWQRADASSIDLCPGPDDDLTAIPDLGMDLVDMMRDDNTPTSAQSEVKNADIIKPVFKPRIVVADDD